MGFKGFERVCANPFLKFQHIQQTCSQFNVTYVSLYFFIMREPVVNELYAKEKLFFNILNPNTNTIKLIVTC